MLLIFANIQYVGKNNQNGHENGPLKTRPKNKKGNLFDQKKCFSFPKDC